MGCIFSWGGFERLEQQVAINQILVGRFNAMLSWGMSLPDFANVKCIVSGMRWLTERATRRSGRMSCIRMGMGWQGDGQVCEGA